MPQHSRVPVDAADVPLQRLVLSVDDGGQSPAPTSACARSKPPIFDLIREHKVTHYCGAPIVHSTLINAPEELRARHRAQGRRRMVAGAAPPAAMIEGMERIGFDLTHVYGLTEVYGPAAVCAKHDEWESARRRARAPSATAARACATCCKKA